jgi:hypothetical protein
MELGSHQESVWSVCYSPDGKLVASAGPDRLVKIWDVASGKCLREMAEHTEAISALAFSPDGTTLVSAGDDKRLVLWDIGTGAVVRTFEGHTMGVGSVAFSPAGSLIASGSGDATVRVWDVEDGRNILVCQGHTQGVGVVAFNPDGRRLASGSADGTIRLWDIKTNKALGVLSGHAGWVKALSFGPSGTQLASGGRDQKICVWDVAKLTCNQVLTGHQGVVWSLAFSPDGTRVASGSGDKTIKVWDPDSGEMLRTLVGHTDGVGTLSFSPDGMKLVSGSADTTLKLWDPGPPARHRQYPPNLVCSTRFADVSGNDALDAEEDAHLVLHVTNRGKGNSYGLTALVSGARPGMTVPAVSKLGNLAAGESATYKIPIRSTRALGAGAAGLTVALSDGRGFDAPLVKQTFETRAFHAPAFTAALGVEDGNGNGLIERGEELKLRIQVRNSGGPARGVRLTVSGPDGLMWLGDRRGLDLGDIPGGGWKEATFEGLVRNQYVGPTTMMLQAAVSEARPDLSVTLPVAMTLNEAAPRVVEQVARARAEENGVLPAPDLDDPVDAAPVRPVKQPNAHAVIIGIEQYKNALVPPVTYARRDATILREYAIKTLGVPADNVHLLVNHEATLADIRTTLSRKLANALEGSDVRVYVYFAGHGAPDLGSKQPFLVPHDGNPAYPDTSCYPLSELYDSLGRLPANVTVMLDACFSGGAGRGDAPGTLLANARPAMVELKEMVTPPNVTVLAAANGEQVSSGFPAKRHGLFTYFLLKGLGGEADADGNSHLTLDEMHRYLTPLVQRQARKVNREQTPTLQGSGGALLY